MQRGMKPRPNIKIRPVPPAAKRSSVDEFLRNWQGTTLTEVGRLVKIATSHREALKRIASADYRGNRPTECTEAQAELDRADL